MIEMQARITPFRSNFYLWNGVSAIFFSNYVTNIHSHNTLQIVSDLHARFRCRIADAPWQACRNLIIRENTPHQLDTNDSVQLIIYLDTETTAARIITQRLLKDQPAFEPDLDLFSIVPPNFLQQALLRSDPTLLREIIGRLLRSLTGEGPATGETPATRRQSTSKPDDRILSIKTAIDTAHPGDVDLTTLATQAHLSVSRLRALFKAHTGVSLYKYILWSRIRYAINRIMTGHAINDAAWDAGFTDNSHFHKMLVTMFGISPSQFLRDNKIMDILTCEDSPLNFETTVYDDNGMVEKIYK
jgi:AraC-like DNA-binding protein